jgi:hypothetical protein
MSVRYSTIQIHCQFKKSNQSKIINKIVHQYKKESISKNITHGCVADFFLHNWHGFKTTASLRNWTVKICKFPAQLNCLIAQPPPLPLSIQWSREKIFHYTNLTEPYRWLISQYFYHYSSCFFQRILKVQCHKIFQNLQLLFLQKVRS